MLGRTSNKVDQATPAKIHIRDLKADQYWNEEGCVCQVQQQDEAAPCLVQSGQRAAQGEPKD